MKKLLLLSLLFCLTQTKAQFVTIPDTAFVSYLNIIVPTAMSGNQMDTTSTLVTTTTHTINVSKKHIASLTGIQYFISLTFLRCDSNQLTTLPALHASLNYLKCNNQFYDSSGYTITTFTSLPTLPNSLTYLDCSSNNISNLPVLPNSLTYLNCSGQSHFNPHGYIVVLTNLPTLPTSLNYLNCSDNNLTTLPTLPASLNYLNCSWNHVSFTSLPALPNSLIHLDCSNCIRLASLPALPNSLTYLDCSSGWCPSSMICCGNGSGNPPPYGLLSCLPVLPNALDTLICCNNSITCFPTFPNSLIYASLDNPYYCLPNYVLPAMNSYTTTPICALGNSHGCTVPANGNACAVAGINKFSENTQLKIYPNPANNKITIDATDVAEVKLFDVLGKQITSTKQNQMDVSNLPEGVYFIQVQNNQNTATQKIIIQH
jgi:Leucine-rich repeat (LRR) protein